MPQGKLGPDNLAPVAGTLAAPAVAEGRDNPSGHARIRLSEFQVERAPVPRLDDEGLLAGQQAKGDR